MRSEPTTNNANAVPHAQAVVVSPGVRKICGRFMYNEVRFWKLLTTGAVRRSRSAEDKRVNCSDSADGVATPIKSGIKTINTLFGSCMTLEFALTPVVVFAVFALGMSALLLILTATLACVLTEHLICRITGKTTTIFYPAGNAGVMIESGEARA